MVLQSNGFGVKTDLIIFNDGWGLNGVYVELMVLQSNGYGVTE